MSQEISQEIPILESESFTHGHPSFYEVVDVSAQMPWAKDPIRIYTLEPRTTDHGLAYKKNLEGSYESYVGGILQNESEAERAEKLKKALLLSSAASGAAATVSASTNPNFFREDNAHKDLLPFGEIGLSLILGVGAYLFKRSRTNARNRRNALEGAVESGSKRFFSRFNPKL